MAQRIFKVVSGECQPAKAQRAKLSVQGSQRARELVRTAAGEQQRCSWCARASDGCGPSRASNWRRRLFAGTAQKSKKNSKLSSCILLDWGAESTSASPFFWIFCQSPIAQCADLSSQSCRTSLSTILWRRRTELLKVRRLAELSH
jgi:hypothetical protein